MQRFTEMVRQYTHGGRRKGSGRKLKNQSHGSPSQRPKNQLGVTSFFSSIRQQSPAPNTPAVSSPSAVEFNIENEQDESPTTTNKNGYQHQHNFDADNSFFDDKFHRKGKIISECEYLRSQRDHIISDQYKTKAYDKVESDGLLWDIPATLFKRLEHRLQDRWKDFHKLPLFN